MFLNNVSTYYLSENILRPHCKEQSAKSVEQKWSVILRILRIQAQILHEETGDKHACALLSFKQIMLCLQLACLKYIEFPEMHETNYMMAFPTATMPKIIIKFL